MLLMIMSFLSTDFCIGSTPNLDDIFPCTWVGLNESGRAEIKNGDLWINGKQIRAISELRVGGQASASSGNSTGSLFKMPVGKVMFLNMRLCSEAMLCKNLTAGCIVITNSRSLQKASVSGEAITQDVSFPTRRKKRAIGDLNLRTPRGMLLKMRIILFLNDNYHHFQNEGYLQSDCF